MRNTQRGRMGWWGAIALLMLLAWGGAGQWSPDGAAPAEDARPSITAPANHAGLPPEAEVVIRRIQNGQPHPYPQDGSTFFNREQRLPQRPRGFYREYTVVTPGLHHRGARRIVTGGSPPTHWYYTDDHYDSFRHFEVTP
jgi:ribonuclease T1